MADDDFAITQGTHTTMNLTLLDEEGNPLILERVWLTVKRLRLDPETKALATKNSHDNGDTTPAEISTQPAWQIEPMIFPCR